MDKKQVTLFGEIVEEEQVREGYIKDHITGKLLKDTPEERRRQEIEKRLVDLAKVEEERREVDGELKEVIQIGFRW